MNGNVTAAIFLLKCRHQYIDQPKPEPQESRVEIKFSLPGPLQPDQYQKVIEATPTKALKEAKGHFRRVAFWRSVRWQIRATSLGTRAEASTCC